MLTECQDAQLFARQKELRDLASTLLACAQLWEFSDGETDLLLHKETAYSTFMYQRLCRNQGFAA